MHSGIRILCLLIFSTLLGYGGDKVLPLAGLLFLVAGVLTGIQKTAAALPMLRRLKYFFLSLLILYLWFTPGQALLPAWGEYSPTLEGLGQGAARISILVLIVLAVNLLLQTTPREQLLAGLLWLLRPLSRVGVATPKLALRLVLVLRFLEQNPRSGDPASAPAGGSTGVMDYAGRRLAWRYREALAMADGESLQTLAVPTATRVPAWQWLLPVVLVAAFQVTAEVLH